ncbi:hypothetical protein [Oryzomicrobium sp.]|uniref:hypothetical protein n=1 Tax=Oryzomicrobium sp. TaxID=1911578 RepID=UPI002FE31680
MANRLKTSKLPNVIKCDWESGEITEKMASLGKVMDRLYEVRESLPLFLVEKKVLGELQRGALLVGSDDTQLPASAEADISGGAVVDFLIDTPLLPPCASSIRQSPRRPGAPTPLAA